MRTLVSILGVVLLAAATRSQTDAPTTEPTVAERARVKIAELEREAAAIIDGWRRALAVRAEQAKAAVDAGEAIPAFSMRPPLAPMVAKFAAAADQFAESSHAPQFLTWIIRNAIGFDDVAVRDAFLTMAARHAHAPEVADIVPMLDSLTRSIGRETVRSFIAKVEQTNRDPDVAGWIAFHEHAPTIEQAPLDSKEFAKAKQLLLARLERVTDEDLRDSIRGAIDTRERFGVGKVAPDIEGVDLDGVPFKLSDYRGKVVFLDFWGDW